MRSSVDVYRNAAVPPWLALSTAVMLTAMLYFTFVWVPMEATMGVVQRIFYFHVPCAMVTFAAVFVLLAGSVAYLWTRRPVWDHLSRAAAETGLVFCTLVLITGPIWAKPAWGVWWTWEARLTTTLLLWLLLVACLMVRAYAPEPDLGARLAAVVGIFAAVDVPIIHKAVEWWRGHHPQVFKPGGGSLAPEMARALGICAVAIFLLFTLTLILRWRIAIADERSRRLLESAARRRAGDER